MEKEFDLKEKRKKIIGEVHNDLIKGLNSDEVLLVQIVLCKVEEQDKEFIRLDDEIIKLFGEGKITEKEMWKRRYKIMGKGLSNGI